MEHRKASFEDHMNMVSSGHQKTAADAKAGKVSPNLLDKLAAELNLEGEKDKAAASGAAATESAQANAPKSEGEKLPADSSVTGANAAVVAATDAVALPQVAAQGGNIAEVVKGEIPAASKPAESGVISDGAGAITTQNSFGKTDEAVAAASRDGGGAGADVAKEAEFIGKKIAQSFQATLEKNASDQEFSECLQFVKEA